MPKELETHTAFDLVEFQNLLGRPVILSTESPEAYKAILVSFMKLLAPRDFLEQMLINNLVDSMWDIQRYQRHKTISIERRFRAYETHAQQRQKTLDELKISIAKGQLGALNVTSETERADFLEAAFEAALSEVKKICGSRPADLDESQALEGGLETQERLDGLLNAAYVRRRRTLEDLERYRQGLGRSAEQIAEIVEAEVEETPRLPADQEVPLAPIRASEPDDLSKQDQSKSS